MRRGCLSNGLTGSFLAAIAARRQHPPPRLRSRHEEPAGLDPCGEPVANRAERRRLASLRRHHHHEETP